MRVGGAIALLSDAHCSSLREHLIDCDDVVLGDFPMYANVGDSLIWLGEIQALRRLGLPVRHAFTVDTYDPALIRSRLGPRTAILIQGGGNFGSLWPRHHLLRLAILRDFRDRLIVQLPQSMYFNDSPMFDQTRIAIREHGRFVLFMRDRQSYELARSAFDCTIALVPDAAFVAPIRERTKASNPWVALMRTDQERGSGSQPLHEIEARLKSAGIQSSDWLQAGVLEDRLAKTYWLAHGARKVFRGLSSAAVIRVLEGRANASVRRGECILSRGHGVLTDRLHALILAYMLGRRVVFVDNSYAKLGNFVSTWLSEDSAIREAESWSEAINFALARS